MTLPADLAIVVVNYGSSDLLEQNLAGLTQTTDAARIVVVDNFRTHAESDSTAALAAARGWTLVSNDRNVGFGAGMNIGVERARQLGTRRFLLLNPDARVEEDVVVALAEECAANPCSIICPRIIRPDGSVWFNGATLLVSRGRTSTASGADSSAPGGWLTGACMVIHDSLWSALGGFDDDYFLYWEDIDLSWRCSDAGGQLLVRTDLTATHSVGGTQDASGKSPAYIYFNCRNRLVFAAKHLRRRQVLGWLVTSPGYAWDVMQRGGRRAIARNPVALFGAAIRGTAAGSWTAFRELAS